ncbi:MAG: RidA family protein [Microbacterium sp.]
MPLERTIVDTAPAPGGAYSHVVVAGGTIYTAGQVGVDPATGETPSDIGEQTRQSLANIAVVLKEVGADLSQVVKTTCFLTDLAEFRVFDAAYREVFGDGLPARSTVEVGLAAPYRVEIEAVAVVS